MLDWEKGRVVFLEALEGVVVVWIFELDWVDGREKKLEKFFVLKFISLM